MYQDITAQAKSQGTLGEPVKVQEGVKQGCPLSPLLFSLFLDRLEAILDMHITHLTSSNRKHIIHIGALPICLLLFADDLVLLATSLDMLQQQIYWLEDFCRCNLLSINTDKTKAMKMGEANDTMPLYCNNITLEWVDSYKYLGLQINAKMQESYMVSNLH